MWFEKNWGKITRKQVDDILQRRNSPSERLHGFMKRRSCITNLTDFYDRVGSISDETDGWRDSVFRLPEALNSVPHRSLVKKMDVKAGIKG